ncbi:MAG: hypothetical protein OHK0039_03060 [Bacteroidia bacterium]
MVLLIGVAHSQPRTWIDTIASPLDANHLQLEMNIPAGEFFFRPSPTCGQSYCRTASANAASRPRILHRQVAQGLHRLHVSFQEPVAAPAPPAEVAASAANLRLADQLTNIDTYTRPSGNRAEYIADPNLSTDLALDLGVGAARLDFSGISLNRVRINSAFSDVVVDYRSTNQVPMAQFDVHAAKGDIVLKHLEYATADLITIRNDMGQTTLVLGNGKAMHATVYLQSGVGKSVLIIDDRQPVRLTLKTGMFAQVNLPTTFEKVEDNVYVNAAYKQRQQGTQIICTVDFGSVQVLENQ